MLDFENGNYRIESSFGRSPWQWAEEGQIEGLRGPGQGG